jgi:hypothetical protein
MFYTFSEELASRRVESLRKAGQLVECTSIMVGFNGAFALKK